MSDANQCSQQRCEKPAEFSYVWPGRGRMVGCSDCTKRALAILEGLGFPVGSLDVRDLHDEAFR